MAETTYSPNPPMDRDGRAGTAHRPAGEAELQPRFSTGSNFARLKLSRASCRRPGRGARWNWRPISRRHARSRMAGYGHGKYGAGADHLPSARASPPTLRLAGGYSGGWAPSTWPAGHASQSGLGHGRSCSTKGQLRGRQGLSPWPDGSSVSATPIDPASSPALALGGADLPRPGPTASHVQRARLCARPPLTRQPTATLAANSAPSPDGSAPAPYLPCPYRHSRSRRDSHDRPPVPACSPKAVGDDRPPYLPSTQDSSPLIIASVTRLHPPDAEPYMPAIPVHRPGTGCNVEKATSAKP